MYFDCMVSPLGQICLLADDEGLRQLTLSVYHPFEPSKEWVHSPHQLHHYKVQLFEYFSGTRTDFDFKVAPVGNSFQRKVWHQLRAIPYGMTCNYTELADKIGQPHMHSAISMASNINPIPIILPCHRVIDDKGNMTGYRYGVEVKKKLLALEQGEPLI